jgi:hypothetical protein
VANGNNPPYPVSARHGPAGWPGNETGRQHAPTFVHITKDPAKLRPDGATTVTSCDPPPVLPTAFGSIPYTAAENLWHAGVVATVAGWLVAGGAAVVAGTLAAAGVVRGGLVVAGAVLVGAAVLGGTVTGMAVVEVVDALVGALEAPAWRPGPVVGEAVPRVTRLDDPAAASFKPPTTPSAPIRSATTTTPRVWLGFAWKRRRRSRTTGDGNARNRIPIRRSAPLATWAGGIRCRSRCRAGGGPRGRPLRPSGPDQEPGMSGLRAWAEGPPTSRHLWSPEATLLPSWAARAPRALFTLWREGGSSVPCTDFRPTARVAQC